MTKGSMSAVYFQRLTEDAEKIKQRPELHDVYNNAMALYQPLSAETHGFGGGSAILAMANAEAAKEQEMLRQIFGENISIDLRQPGAIKELTETINKVFHFKSIYDRNKALLLSEDFNGQKGVFSYFHTYFNQALKRALPTLSRDIKARMLANHSLKAGDAAKIVFTESMPRIIDNAIKRMFGNATTELQSMDSKYKDAYREIINAMGSFRGSIIAQQLYNAWGMDEVINKFTEAFSATTRRKPKKGTMEKARGAAMSQMSSGMHSKGGLSLEAIIDQCIGMTVDGINGAGGANVDISAKAGMYKGAGDVRARADNVFYFGMDGAPVDKAFQEARESNSDRKTTVDVFSRLGKELDEVKGGFIVYVNDKNYTLNDNFRRRGGMSAGTDWTLEQVRGILGGVVGNIDQVVYNILQNGAGAIKAGDTANTSKVLAEGIAYYLFDDYATIGNPGGNAIHIMGLQGMLIPLSAFLYALGTAIQTVESNPDSYVQVRISAPAVNDSNEASYYMTNWDRQYNDSLTRTRISIHFMENFTGFVRGFL